jgi:CDP-diacylglycerol--serine O-phosphatidyltransferase
MKILKMLSVADLVTLLNIVFGASAIFTMIYGAATGDPEFMPRASMLILMGILADGLDGKLARYFKSEHTLGQDLDSLADAITFSLAPACLVFVQYFQEFRVFRSPILPGIFTGDVILGGICVLIVLCGVLRLARFNQGGQADKFVGLPSPANALVVTVFMLFPEQFRPFWVVLPIVVAQSLLMISDVEYPKMRGKIAAIAGSIVASLVLLLAFVQFRQIDIPKSPVSSAAIIVLGLVFLISYIAIGPVYQSRSAGKTNRKKK